MPRVLIIEDSADVRSLLVLALRGEGYETSTAVNGAEGLVELRRAKPEFILLDLMMPVMDGFEFLRQKNADAAIASVPTLVMSALDREGRDLLGVVGFMRKPLDLGGLLDVIAEHASN